MQKNLYFRSVLRRRNAIGEAILGLFLKLASYPRLLLEVFIRKNFGDRYFSLATAITIVAVFLFFPYFMLTMNSRFGNGPDLFDIVKSAPSIFVFLGLFLLVSIWHHLQIRQGPSVFDFERFSLSSGNINPIFFEIQLFGKKPSIRLIETVYEPLLFFIIGWLLIKMDVAVGYLIFISSIFYSLGYVGAYKQGDDFVKDKIDEMIMNGEMANAFIGDEDNNKKGVRFRTEKPKSHTMREDLAGEFVVDEKETAEAF